MHGGLGFRVEGVGFKALQWLGLQIKGLGFSKLQGSKVATCNDFSGLTQTEVYL